MRFHLLPTFLVLFVPVSAVFSQVRLSTLTLQPKEVYEFRGTDIVSVDTLILLDSSRIILNTSKADNFLYVKKMKVGKGVRIIGRGENGVIGRAGISGASAGGPCRDGLDGTQGSVGGDGSNAVNLLIYVTSLEISGNLMINLTGGDGGEGGKGGMGGGGSSGTRVCPGGSGGAGGPGSAGGNGGNGGNLTITSPYGADLRPQIGDKIIVRSLGGFAGLGGESDQH